MDVEDFTAVSTSLDDTTVAFAKEKIWDKRHQGTKCPCCGQVCKVYKRSITKPMAIWLRTLVITWREEGGLWIDTNNHPNFDSINRGGDYAKLRYWGLTEHSGDKRNPKKSGSVRWRPTESGALWVDGQFAVQRFAHVYLGEVVKFSGPLVSISHIFKKDFPK